MDKNTIIGIVLSTLVVIAGITLQTILFPPAETSAATEQQETVATTSPVNENTENPNTNETLSLLTDVDVEDDTEESTEKFYEIDTDLVQVKFTNRGGDVVSYKLKKHSEKGDFIEMADAVTDNNKAFSIILGDSNEPAINQIFHTKIINDTTIGFFRNFTVKNTDGSESSFTLAKQYTFLPDDYMFELKVTIDGDSSLKGLRFGNSAYTIKTSPQIGPEWNAKQDKYEYRRFYYLLNGKKKKLTLNAGQKKTINDTVTWTGVAGKYFTLIALPENQIDTVTYSTVASSADVTNAQMFISRPSIVANKNTDTWRFYIGPRTEKELGKYNVAIKNPYSLDDTKIDEIVESSGILGPVEIMLKWLMEIFYKVIPNWGVAIVILTVLVRVLLFPLTKKGSQATLKMQELNPKIQEIQTKYKDNQQKMNEEMAKLYQTAGYNPLSGCLPILIQFPLIFAMYNLFNNYFEFRGAMFIPGWIPDLSKGDSVLQFPFTVPILGWTELHLLPIIYVISQLIQGKITQTPGASQQNASMKIMLYGMPLFFFFVFYNAPAGLLIYWILTNVLSMGQQMVINRAMKLEETKKEVAKPQPVIKKTTKSHKKR